MSQEDVELLEAVRNWRPPTKLHPMAMSAYHLYERLGMSLPAEGVVELRAMLDAHRDDLKTLAEHIEGLARFMILIAEHFGDVAGSKRVADLMREYTPLFEPFWRRVGEALDNVGSETKGSFQRFTGDVEEKVAVVHDAAKPTGTIPLSTLLNPARPPPWARKKAAGAR